MIAVLGVFMDANFNFYKQIVKVGNDNRRLVHTGDGSVSYYSYEFGESYHARSVGAYSESLLKHLYPSNCLNMLTKKDVRVLDISFGLGYNIAVTLEKSEPIRELYKNRLHIVSVELDHTLFDFVYNNRYLVSKGHSILRNLMKGEVYNNASLEFYNCDVVEFIDNIQGIFDVIYFDPFSIEKTPLLWSTEFLQKIYERLSHTGIMTTYATARAIRERLETVGFNVYRIKNKGSLKSIGNSLIATKS